MMVAVTGIVIVETALAVAAVAAVVLLVGLFVNQMVFCAKGRQAIKF